MIKAPFNFVPCNNTVFFPEWAIRISHDVPFSDSISGYIPIRITAESPIFIRNGHALGTEDNTFNHTPDGKYYIPGTSIKGELKNVLEILSFGKMSNVQNKRFGYRDLSPSSAVSKNYKDKIDPKSIHCGWLYREVDQYYIRDCGLPKRISPKAIDRALGTSLDDFAKNGIFNNDLNRRAAVKYAQIKKHNNGEMIYHGIFSADTGEKAKPNSVIFGHGQNEFMGHLILTGQSGPRKEETKKGKYWEFVFPDVEGNEKNIRKIDEHLIEDFVNIHSNNPEFKSPDKKESGNNPDPLWLKKFRDGKEIPVFFRYRKESGGRQTNQIEAIGLAYMFRFPTAHMIYSAMPAEHLMKNIPDLAECIFGYTGKTCGSLKGRVSVSNAYACDNVRTEKEIKIVLSSPKPSYYPIYVDGGHSWNENGATISGRKRYPVRDSVSNYETGNEKMVSKMIPLAKGTVFEGKIRFFNLRPAELGALLASVTFLGEKDCFHSLGSGKPLGYGKVSMTIPENSINCDKEVSTDELIGCFRELMKSRVNNWEHTPQLKELFAMSKGIPLGKEDMFMYMNMSTTGNNEFNEYKNSKKYLSRFSEILKGNTEKTSTPRADMPQQYFDKLKEDIEAKEKHIEESLHRGQNALSAARELYETDQAASGKKLESLAKAKALLESAKNFCDYQLVQADAENLVKIIDSEISKTKNEFEVLIHEAETAKANKDYDSALAFYQKAQNTGVRDVSDEIERINKLKESASCSSIGDFLNTINLASVPAFAGALQKKWIVVHGQLSDNEITTVGNFLKDKIGSISSKNKSEWQNFKKWKDLIKYIGHENAEKLFRLITE